MYEKTCNVKEKIHCRTYCTGHHTPSIITLIPAVEHTVKY